jgi:hypothetical protein
MTVVRLGVPAQDAARVCRVVDSSVDRPAPFTRTMTALGYGRDPVIG